MPVGRRLMTIWIALSLALAGGSGFGAWTLFGPEDAYEYHGGFFGTAWSRPAWRPARVSAPAATPGHHDH